MNAAEPKGQAAQLDRAAIHVRAAQLNAARAQLMVRRDTVQAAQFANDAKDAAARALTVLCGDLGAQMPPVQPETATGAKPQSGGLDLSELAMLDSPEARAVLDLLIQTQAAAEKLDALCGRAGRARIATSANESRGVDYAESVSMLAIRLRGEIFGGTGRD